MDSCQIDSWLLGGLISYLESCPGVSKVNLFTRPPASSAIYSIWEKQTQFPLPCDLRDFLLITDGMVLKWSVLFPHLNHDSSDRESCFIGNIAINCLERILPFNPKHNQFFLISQEMDDAYTAPGPAFILQDATPFGKVCLVYTDPQDKHVSSIYFYSDSTNKWYPIAKDFMSYFRLQLQFLGIHGWQLSGTEMGLPQATMDWLNFYAPHQIPYRPTISNIPNISNSSIRKIKGSRRETRVDGINFDKLIKLISLELKERHPPTPFQRPMSSTSTKSRK